MSTTMNYTGAVLFDEQGEKIGDVTDVIYDGVEETPTWLIVKPGVLRAEHYVPARPCYRTETDDLVAPFSTDQVKGSPKAKGDHVLSDDDRMLLGQHYAITNLPRTS